jgi:hypothetical protein
MRPFLFIAACLLIAMGGLSLMQSSEATPSDQQRYDAYWAEHGDAIDQADQLASVNCPLAGVCTVPVAAVVADPKIIDDGQRGTAWTEARRRTPVRTLLRAPFRACGRVACRLRCR